MPPLRFRFLTRTCDVVYPNCKIGKHNTRNLKLNASASTFSSASYCPVLATHLPGIHRSLAWCLPLASVVFATCAPGTCHSHPCTCHSLTCFLPLASLVCATRSPDSCRSHPKYFHLALAPGTWRSLPWYRLLDGSWVVSFLLDSRASLLALQSWCYHTCTVCV